MFTGAINVSAPAHFSEGVSPGLLTSVNCSGSEEKILDCEHISSLLFCDTAGVLCQGMTVIYVIKMHTFVIISAYSS